MKKVCLSVLAGLLFLFASCKMEVGMGSAVDLEAPVLTITDPKTLSNVHKHVVIKGTCTDNIKVERVSVSNKITGESYGNAKINGQEWSIELDLEEGEATLNFEAIDSKHNISTRSIKTLTLLVDETAPEGLSWYIDRGNAIQTPFMEKSDLEKLDISLSVNKDIPQNERFEIHGRMYDAMSIDEISLILTDEETGKSIKAEVKAESLPENKSIFTPVFTFTHEDIIAVMPELASGKHYLKASFYSKDEHGNNDTKDLAYLMWYPESDYPGIQRNLNSEGEISVGIGSYISLPLFDDDGVEEIHFDLFDSLFGYASSSEWEEILASDSDEGAAARKVLRHPVEEDGLPTKTDDSSKIEYSGSNYIRDIYAQLQAPDKPCVMYLVAAVKDINGKWNAKVVKTNITDIAKPLLLIENPLENSIPNMKAGVTGKQGKASVFEIAGYSLDTKGSNRIEIVYVPDSTTAGNYSNAEQKEARAKQIIDSVKNGSAKTDDGEIYKVLKFPEEKTPVSGWVKEQFSFEFDILEDFGDAAKDQKFFFIKLTDTDNNIVEKVFQINGDTDLPDVEVKSPEINMAVCNYLSDDLVLSFRGVKPSGLGIDLSKYKIEHVYTTKNGDFITEVYSPEQTGYLKLTETPAADGKGSFYTAVIPKDTLRAWAEGDEPFQTDGQPVFTFYTTDVLGNVNTLKRTVMLSPLPYLESISSDLQNGTFKANDIISLKAKFSDSVIVTGTPTIELSYDDSDPVSKYASYVSGSGTDTLVFNFTVPDGAESAKLLTNKIIANVENDEENEYGTIKTGTVGDGPATLSMNGVSKLQDSKTFVLDGVAPTLSLAEFLVDNVSVSQNTYVTKDSEISVVLTASENILVSGNPILRVNADDTVNGGTGSKGGIIDFTFQGLSNNTITFACKVSSLTKQGILSVDFNDCFNSQNSILITDEPGNKLKLSSASNKSESKIIVDTVKPAVPVIQGLENQKTYTKNQTLTITQFESDAVVKYSKDGGVSWSEYNDSNKPVLGNGSYRLMVSQTDKAGNTSDPSNECYIVINTKFPTPTGFSISRPDGNYKKDDVITFKLTFDEKVKVPSANTKITFTNKDGTQTRTVSAKVNNTLDSTVLFEYTVRSTDEIYGIKTTNITFGSDFVDKNENKPDSSVTTDITTFFNDSTGSGGIRNNIILDGVAPEISSYNPAINGIVSNGNVVTLTFSEPVFKESGIITLRRKGNWYIPPVLTETEFYAVYNELDSENQQKLMRTDSAGTAIMHSKTGASIGPYQKVSHGLLGDSEAGPAPDTTTKFVLNPKLNIDSGSATLDEGITVNVADIRSAFEAAGYHKQELDVTSTSVSINSNVVTITFPDTLVDGREWELFIPAGTFRDSTGNIFGGLGTYNAGKPDTSTYSYWSNKVAKPVIRVDRYSHGWGAEEPDSTGAISTTISTYDENSYATENTGGSVSPTGYARVRIDCETPGAVITYGVDGSQTREQSITETSSYVLSNYGTVTDKTNDQIKAISATSSYTQNTWFAVGDGALTTSRRDYVKALATKTNFTASDAGYEGVFKTVVITRETNNLAVVKIEGSTKPGAMPTVSNFPVRDATADKRYCKQAYSTDGKVFYWISYDIVSDWSAMPKHKKNYTEKYYDGSYGLMTYIYHASYYTGE